MSNVMLSYEGGQVNIPYVKIARLYIGIFCQPYNNCKKEALRFVGTPYLLHALARNGYSETAYSLLLQEEFPSWLYSVKAGATTVWEHWDGIKADGSFWSPNMNSFNHYAYGAVADFMYEVMAGINTSESAPGFKHIEFRPIVDKRIEYVHASIDTKYGFVKSGWKYENDQIHYYFIVPEGCSATVFLDNTSYDIGAGRFELKSDIGNQKMIIDGNPTEKKAMEAFLRGDYKEGTRIQDEFIAEVKEALKTQDHCTCEVKDCKFHGKCLLCVLIHRGHGHHLPNCFRDIANENYP